MVAVWLFLRFKENENILQAFALLNHLTTINFKIINTVMPPFNAQIYCCYLLIHNIYRTFLLVHNSK